MSSRKNSVALYATQTAALEGARIILEEVESSEFVAQFFTGASVDIKRCREDLGISEYPGGPQVLSEGFKIRLHNRCFEKKFAIAIQVNQKIDGSTLPIAGILIEDDRGQEKPFAQENGMLYEFLKLGDPLKLTAVVFEPYSELMHG